MKFLSAGFECWNCVRLAPTHDNGMFKHLVLVEGENPHPVCEVCKESLSKEGFQVVDQAEEGLVIESEAERSDS